MKRRDVASLLLLGLIIWAVGTILYAYSGPVILETTSFRYWWAFATSPVFSAILCIVILYRRRIPAAHWASAMLLLGVESFGPGRAAPGTPRKIHHQKQDTPRLRSGGSLPERGHNCLRRDAGGKRFRRELGPQSLF